LNPLKSQKTKKKIANQPDPARSRANLKKIKLKIIKIVAIATGTITFFAKM